MTQEVVYKLILLLLGVHKPNPTQDQALNKLIVKAIEELKELISLVSLRSDLRVSRATSKLRLFLSFVKVKSTVVIRGLAIMRTVRSFQVQSIILSRIIVRRVFFLKKEQWTALRRRRNLRASHRDRLDCSKLLIKSFFQWSR